jgi:hypothetical protein
MTITKSESRNSLDAFWRALAALICVGGAANFVGTYSPWEGTFAQANDFYRALITGPIDAVARTLWPYSLLAYPRWLAAYIVFCAGMFIVINVTWRASMGRTLIFYAFKDSGPLGGSVFLLFTFFLTPPVLPLALLIFDSLSREGKAQIRTQLNYYLFIVLAVAALASVNYLSKTP